MSAAETVPPAVAVEALTYAYPDGTRALDALELAVAADERVALLGANGAGKSTLLLHLNGILACSPKVKILGLTVEKGNLREIRRRVGLVFQNPDDQLFCPTVYDDVAFGPRNLGLSEPEVRDRVRDSLDAVGFGDAAERTSFHLSVGQKKRVALASVLAMGCEVLVLDEPTSALDPRGRRELIALLRRIGRTQLIATHDLDFVAQLCGRAVVLSRGKVVRDESPEAVLGDRALLEAHGLA
ncbi:MAG: ATP-binding cassette domain-containing protein [bacterium]